MLATHETLVTLECLAVALWMPGSHLLCAPAVNPLDGVPAATFGIQTYTQDIPIVVLCKYMYTHMYHMYIYKTCIQMHKCSVCIHVYSCLRKYLRIHVDVHVCVCRFICRKPV